MGAQLGKFEEAVGKLSSAAQGSYSGPGVTAAAVHSSYDTTAGLEPASLRSAVIGAVGGSSGGTVGTLGSHVLDLLGDVAIGFLASKLGSLAEDFLTNRRDSQEVERDGEAAGDAVEDIQCSSDNVIEQILSRLEALISQLTALLAGIDPLRDPGGFAACVSQGAAAIDAAGQGIVDICRARDEALDQCYCLLEERVTAVCSVPQTAPPQPCSTVALQQSTVALEPPVTTQRSDSACPPPATIPQSTEPEPIDKPEDCSLPATPQQIACETPVTPQPREAELTECEVPELATSCSGTCGAAGMGVALLVVAAIAYLVTDALAECELPAPELPLAPEPAISLDSVPEPDPPAEKLAHLQPAAVEPSVSLDPVPEPDPPAEKLAHLRKAGAW